MHQFDDVKLGFDNNADGDIADAGDDVLVDDDFNSNQSSLSYDDNGNLTADGVYNYVYDAWNRLRKAQLVVGSDTTTIGEYEYFGDTRRSKKTVTNHGSEVVANDGGNTTVVFYYGSPRPHGEQSPDRQGGVPWNIVETRNGSNQTTMQMLPGTRYTDEWIWIEVNGDPSASDDTNPDNTADGEGSEDPADMRYFVHQDRNWNVIALTEYDPNDTNNGRIAERYSYTPYGCFVVSSGDSGSGEFSSVSLTSTVGNPFTHQGLTFDQEKGSCQNRFREYSAQLHRFSERDPLGLRAGFGLYHYLDARPTFSKDPLGLLATCCSSWPTQADAEAGVDQGELCRDTWYGGLLHPGQNCYREAYACSAGACQVCYDQDDGECHASWDNYGPACGIDEDGYCEYGWGGPVWDHLLGDVLIPAWIRWKIGTIPPWFVTIPPWFVP